MGKRKAARPTSGRSALQVAQNAALPIAILLVVGVLGMASPAIRGGAEDVVDGSFTAAETSGSPEPSTSPTGRTRAEGEAKGETHGESRREAKRKDLAYRAGIIPATIFAKKSKPQVPRGYVRVSRSSLLPTSFTVTSWNVLGHGHTVPGGNRPGWASGHTRIRWAVSLLRGRDVSVVGLQEFQLPQFQTFNAVAGAEYAAFPGAGGGQRGVQNSIAWRRADWSLIEAHTIAIPYFTGPMPMPYVLLEHQQTGQRVWFTNFHNPADAHGPAEGKRDQATGMEIALFNRLRAQTGDPVVVTGDMNERDEYLCRVAAGAAMHSADGGSASGGACIRPPQMNVDWILATLDVDFSAFAAVRTGLAGRVSDHPMVVSDAVVAPTRDAAKCRQKSRTSPYVWCPPA